MKLAMFKLLTFSHFVDDNEGRNPLKAVFVSLTMISGDAFSHDHVFYRESNRSYNLKHPRP